MKILIHGDSKIDNFMFKKAPGALDDHYIALIIDWQGACYDLLSGDLVKNDTWDRFETLYTLTAINVIMIEPHKSKTCFCLLILKLLLELSKDMNCIFFQMIQRYTSIGLFYSDLLNT